MKIKIDLTPMEREAFYDWTDDDGSVIHFRTTVMERFLRDNPLVAMTMLVETPIDADFAQNFLPENGGIEQEHLDTLTAARLDVPVISVLWPDGSCLLIDGNHRYYRRWQLGYKTVWTYVLPPDLWEHFTMPSDMRWNMFRNATKKEKK